MMGPLLAASLFVVSASAADPAVWSCAYLAERLPRALRVLGEDAVSGEEARSKRAALDLPGGPLSRASSLALARELGATRLAMVQCRIEAGSVTIEARSFATSGPEGSAAISVTRPAAEIAAAVDDVARQLTGDASASGGAPPLYRVPNARALEKAGPALLRRTPSDRAVALAQALVDDPTSFDLRLSLVEALLGARDFDAAARLAAQASLAGAPPILARMLRFHLGTALLEAGRYAEARDVLRRLAGERESAAVLNNLGVALFRLRDPEGPATFGRAAALADHRQADIAFNHSLTLIFQDRADLAIPRLDAALAADKDDVRTRLLKVWALRQLKREDDRRAEWERLVEDAPSFAGLGNPDPVRRLERIFLHERTAAP